MKIVYIVPSLDFFTSQPFGGKVAHALGVIQGLSDKNTDVAVLAESGVLNHNIDSHVRLHTFDKIKDGVIPFKLLKKIMSEVDIIIYRKSALSFLWISYLRWLNVLSSRKVRIVSEVNGLFFSYTGIEKYPIRDFIAHTLHKIFLRYDDMIQTVDDDLKLTLTTGFLKINNNKVVTINNGGPVKNIINKVQPAKKIKIIFYGKFTSYNGIEQVFRVFGSISEEVDLELIGDGVMRLEWEKLSKDVSNVTFHGYKSLDEFDSLISESNCMCVGLVPMNQGNSTNSLSPVKGFYYLSRGLPILFSDFCYQDTLENEKVGFSYKYGDDNSLIEAFYNISNKDKTQEMLQNIDTVYHKYTWSGQMEKLVNKIMLVHK
jgi:glycosyltransferase involved in cell wall biosynthesis